MNTESQTSRSVYPCFYLYPAVKKRTEFSTRTSNSAQLAHYPVFKLCKFALFLTLNQLLRKIRPTSVPLLWFVSIYTGETWRNKGGCECENWFSISYLQSMYVSFLIPWFAYSHSFRSSGVSPFWTLAACEPTTDGALSKTIQQTDPFRAPCNGHDGDHWVDWVI